jgi:hypothetical protein
MYTYHPAATPTRIPCSRRISGYRAFTLYSGGTGPQPAPHPIPRSSEDRPECDTTNATNAKVIKFITANIADAQKPGDATGLSSDFILAWAATESGYGISQKATLNSWVGAIDCPPNAGPGFSCFEGPGLLLSGEDALFSQNGRYLQAALGAQKTGNSVAHIANEVAAAGFYSEFGNGVYGTRVDAAAQANARRKDRQ